MMCGACRAGRHNHDWFPNGDGADCPNLADPGAFFDKCDCPLIKPTRTIPTCPTCGCDRRHR